MTLFVVIPGSAVVTNPTSDPAETLRRDREARMEEAHEIRGVMPYLARVPLPSLALGLAFLPAIADGLVTVEVAVGCLVASDSAAPHAAMLEIWLRAAVTERLRERARRQSAGVTHPEAIRRMALLVFSGVADFRTACGSVVALGLSRRALTDGELETLESVTEAALSAEIERLGSVSVSVSDTVPA